MPEVNRNETLSEFAARLSGTDDAVRMTIAYVPGKGFAVLANDFNSMSFSATGWGVTLQEALARLDMEIACESPLDPMPDWATYALERD